MKRIILLSYLVAFMLGSSAQNPVPCNIANCTITSDVCPPGGTNLVSAFKNAQLILSGNGCSNGLCPGSVWRFSLVATGAGKRINATVTIDAVVNAELVKIDDETATDPSGADLQSLFVPVIKSNMPLNGTDRKGYVQFSVRFFKADVNDGYSVLTNLSSLTASLFDLEGNNAGNIVSGTNGSWYRETAHLKEVSASNPSLVFDNTTELTAHNTSDASGNWPGGEGSLCERNGVALCSEAAMAGRYSLPQHTITFRLGYDYNAGGNIGSPESQFGVKFSCFNFPNEIQLPVNLYEFTAKRNGNMVQLDWITTYEQMNQGFVVQRKTGTGEFSDITFIPSQAPGGNSQINLFYRFTDANPFKGISQYRIVQTDLQNKIRVSEIRSVMGMGQDNSILIYPNPGTDGRINILFDESRTGKDVVINDISGRIIKSWKQATGNTITAENLLPGFYAVKITDRETGHITVQKFVISQ